MFAADYFGARDAFRRAAGDAFESLALSARGPCAEALTIDVAWLGERAAERLLLVSSGIHGVEGFAGSAVQCAFLQSAPAPPNGCAVVLLHALNPWGFAHLRRVNENNVDLNRNFLRPGEEYAGAPPHYRALDTFLNPRSAPRADGYYLRALGLVVRHGMASLRQTISGGQYEFERGLFFGGRGLEEGPRRILHWLAQHCARASHLLAIDLHTGLGRFGALTIFSERGPGAERTERLSRALRLPIVAAESLVSGPTYSIRGAMCAMLPQLLPRASIDVLTAEFGTYPGPKMLYALREENRWHHFGSGALDHPAKRRLRAAFNPELPRWRDAVVVQGTELLRRSLSYLAAP
jgi:predicted deacylase